MYKVGKIKFKPLIEDKELIREKLSILLGMLYKNGQILKEYVVENHENYYIANVITTDDNSLDSKYYSEYTIEAVKDFEIEYEIICDEAGCTDSCHCSDHSYYVLAIETENSPTSPILCGDCGKEIPLIYIPYINGDKEHFKLLSFQHMYYAVDTLWIQGLADNFTKKQIINYKSQLNKTGMEICKELEKKLNKPVYYFLCNPIGGFYEPKKNRKNLSKCPKCNKNFVILKDSYIDKVCHKCRLAIIDCEEL